MTDIKKNDWVRFHGTFESDPEKKVSGVAFEVEAKDVVSTTTGVDRVPIYVSDLQFQAGEKLTGWVPKTEELMNKLSWTNDENENLAEPYTFAGRPTQVREGVNKRWFNIVGRGANTFVLPNYYPDDFEVPVLSTGIELKLFPKDDYDLVRISTSHGAEIPEKDQFYKREGSIYQEIKRKYEQVSRMNPTNDETRERKNQEVSNWENIIEPLVEGHPLHTRYTREFYIDGGKAGDEIIVDATKRIATVNGKEVKIVGERNIDIDGTKFPIDRKKFMIAPKGTATLRIEFYRQVERDIVTYDQDSDYNYVKVEKKFKLLEDVGIGYHGTAGFNQWTYGLSRI